MNPRVQTLTNQQIETYRAIEHLTQTLGYPPNLEELAQQLGLDSIRCTSTYQRLCALQRVNLVSWQMSKPRTLKLDTVLFERLMKNTLRAKVHG